MRREVTPKSSVQANNLRLKQRNCRLQPSNIVVNLIPPDVFIKMVREKTTSIARSFGLRDIPRGFSEAQNRLKEWVEEAESDETKEQADSDPILGKPIRDGGQVRRLSPWAWKLLKLQAQKRRKLI